MPLPLEAHFAKLLQKRTLGEWFQEQRGTVGKKDEPCCEPCAERAEVQKVVSRRSGEERSAFISRCMEAEAEAFPDPEQRAAVCNAKADE